MKQITLYSAKATPSIQLSPAALYTPLTQQQDTSIGLVELFEGKTLQELAIPDNNTLALKIKHSVRKEPKQEVIDAEVDTRLKGDETEEQIATIEEEVYLQAKRLAGVTHKTYMAFVNFGTNEILIDAPRNTADEGIAFILQNIIGNSSECEFELFKQEAVLMEKLLTQYVIKSATLPEPFTLGNAVKMGDKSILDEKPTNPNINITKDPVYNQEILNHIKAGKYVKLLEVTYDGALDVKIDNTFYMSGITYDESFKADKSVADSVNFMTEYTDKLATIYAAVGILQGELDKVSI